MNKPITIDSELARIFGRDARSFYAEHLDTVRQIKSANPLRDCTPVTWDTTPFPADVEL